MYSLGELKKMCIPNNRKGKEETAKEETFDPSLRSCQNLLGEGEKKVPKESKCKDVLRLSCIVVLPLLAFLVYYYRPLNLCFGKDGKPGKCLEIFQCPFIFKDIKEGKEPVICEYSKKKLKICCIGDDKVPDVGARHLIPIHDHDKDFEEEHYKIVFKDQPKIPKHFQQDNCKPLTNYSNSGRISFRKCLEYQDRLVYPCQDSWTPNGGKIRVDLCNDRYPDSLILDGDKAYFGEFPHMALLGYETRKQTWQCAGVIISEYFILTAGHCTYSPNGGNVSKIRIGFLRKSDKDDPKQLYGVDEIHKHPDYSPPKSYHDIALLKTDRPMELNRYAVPACLHDGGPIKDTKVTATGWGAVDVRGKHVSDILRKVTLEKFTDEECGRTYTKIAVRKMPQGYENNTQICYGDRTTRKDSNKGDSGGPLQIKHPLVKCMYLVTAIITNGKYLGVPGSPGLYTRVAPYLDWIEKVVWS